MATPPTAAISTTSNATAPPLTLLLDSCALIVVDVVVDSSVDVEDVEPRRISAPVVEVVVATVVAVVFDVVVALAVVVVARVVVVVARVVAVVELVVPAPVVLDDSSAPPTCVSARAPTTPEKNAASAASVARRGRTRRTCC